MRTRWFAPLALPILLAACATGGPAPVAKARPLHAPNEPVVGGGRPHHAYVGTEYQTNALKTELLGPRKNGAPTTDGLSSAR